jgi:hypothetical protein
MKQAPGQIVLLGEILGACPIKLYKFAIYGKVCSKLGYFGLDKHNSLNKQTLNLLWSLYMIIVIS